MNAAIVLQPGNVSVVRSKMLAPWRGLPIFDLEIDPSTPTLPSGKVSLAIGGSTVSGTVDPRGSGQFAGLLHVRVLAGGGGWDKPVARRHYHADNGVTLAQVAQTTATEVGETVTVLSPGPGFPDDFVRGIGPASRVLDQFDWWVGLDGVTQVGARPALKPDPSLVLLRYDPTLQEASIGCDALVLPGTQISDPRLPAGPITVRDVEQHFDAAGSRVTAWCGASPVSQLLGDLQAAIVELSGRKFLASYLYQIVQQGPDGRLQLQAVPGSSGLPDPGVPDTLPLSPWAGMSGDSASFKLGSRVRVSFFAADPSRPIVDSYEPGVVPLKRTVDATVQVDVGPSAALVALAGGADALVLSTPYKALLAALTTFATGLNPTTLAGQAAALVTALATPALQSASTLKIKGT